MYLDVCYIDVVSVDVCYIDVCCNLMIFMHF
jgi:hypothetical protein